MFDKSKKMTKEIWWLILLTGVAGLVFGLIALLWPKLTLSALVYMVAVFTIVGGMVGLFEALVSIKKDRLWWLALLFAALNIGVGVFLLRNPLITAKIFVMMIAVVIMIRAIFDLAVASYMQKEEGRWLWILTGVFGFIAALGIMFYPKSASLAFTWVLGLYALVHGVTTVAFAVQVRKEIKKLR